MKKAVKLIILALALITVSGCKSSCDCFKHSYGHNNYSQQDVNKA